MTSTQEKNISALLDEGLAQMALPLSANQREKIQAYIELLAKWNQTYNLTAVREPERMIGLHILDSLAVLPHMATASRILDVGTGGGLPGLPLAIAQPAWQITLLDSLQKKTTFVQQAISELALTNATVICERIEKFSPPEKFDVIISRAFAELADFVSGAAHALAEGGKMLAMKGLHPYDEIARLPATHRVTQTIELTVPQIEGKRHLVVIEKNPA